MSLRRAARAAVPAVLLALALAVPGAQGAPAQPPAPVPAAGPLRIFALDSRPVSFIRNGQPTGFAIELAQALIARMDGRVRLHPVEVMPWVRAHTMAAREANVLLLTAARTPGREHYLTFVGPLFPETIFAYALTDRAEALRALGPGLRKLRAGARRGSMFVDMARAAGYTIVDEPAASRTGVKMLMSQRFDLWIDGEDIVGPALHEAGYGREAVAQVAELGTVEIHLAFSRGTSEATVAAFESALRAMKRDGSYQRLLREWLPGLPPTPETRRHGLLEQR